MIKKFNLKAEIRKDDEKISEIIKKGFIPAVIYGGKSSNQNLKINKNQFIKIYEQAGESSLVDLTVDDTDAIKVIVKDVQYEHIKGVIRHADFFRINMSVAIEIEIPLQFIGSDKAIKDLGGMVLTNIEAIHAKCLPGDLIDNLEVDLSQLKTLGDSIQVKDLDIPENIELLIDENTSIVSATLPRQEKEEVVEEESEEEAGDDSKKEEKGDDKKDTKDAKGDNEKKKEEKNNHKNNEK